MNEQYDLFKELGDALQPERLVHTRENNRESEQHLKENRELFGEKCMLLIKKFCAGERLLFCDEVIDHLNDSPEQKKNKVGDLRRRVKDLKEKGIVVQCTWVKGAGIKEYWMTPQEISRVKQLYKL